MIPTGVEIFVGLQPIDLRWGFDRLAGIVEERIGRKPRNGALFVFFGKRRSDPASSQRCYGNVVLIPFNTTPRFRPGGLPGSGARRASRRCST